MADLVPADLPPAHARGRPREVLVLAWPVIVSVLSLTVMNAADTYFAGRLGTAEQAAVGFCGTILWTVYSFFLGTLDIIQTFVAQHVGAGDPKRAWRYGVAGLHAGLAFSFFMIPMALAGRWPYVWLGVAPEIIAPAATYSVIRFAGSAPYFLSRGAEGYFRGVGDTFTPMVIAVVANVVNVALAWLAVTGCKPLGIPSLGVAGLGYATVIATCVQLAGFGIASRRRRSRGDFAPRLRDRSRREDLRDLLRLGAPAGVAWLLDIAAWSLFTIEVARVEASQAAANVIAITLLRASFMPGFAIGTAAQTLVGRYLGAGDVRSAARSGWTSVALAGSYMGVLGLVFFLFGGDLFGLFTADANVREHGAHLMRWAAVFQIGDAFQVVLGGALRGAGDTRFVAVVVFSAAWGVFAPLAWWLVSVRGMGVEGGWMACTIWVAALATPLALRFRGNAWRKTLVQPEEPRLHPETEVA
ncbi:MAG: MATE family efflux transporter [bacterium]